MPGYDEQAKAHKRAYYLATREKRIEYARAYYQANRTMVIKKNIAYAARRKERLANQEIEATPEEA